MNGNIVSFIRELCEEHNISIGELEKKLGFSQGLISRWDKNSPSIDKIVAVANSLNVTTDYLLGRDKKKQSPKIEECFIEKLINDTKNNRLNWKPSSYQYINESTIIALSFGYLQIKEVEYLGGIDAVYELEFNASCLYLVSTNYNSVSSSLLLMQVDKSCISNENNLIIISSRSEDDKIGNLENEVNRYLETNTVKDKSRTIMLNYVNNDAGLDLPYEPIPYSRIVNNCLSNNEIPGFVLDARQGSFLFNQILQIWEKIGCD